MKKAVVNEYITSTSMNAMRDTMAVASTVLGLDILELWVESDGKLLCVYVHATAAMTQNHPGIITGHFPAHKTEHKHSPKVIMIHWFPTPDH